MSVYLSIQTMHASLISVDGPTDVASDFTPNISKPLRESSSVECNPNTHSFVVAESNTNVSTLRHPTGAFLARLVILSAAVFVCFAR